jgi:MFS family permease
MSSSTPDGSHDAGVYSAFDRRAKVGISFVASTAAMFSGLTSFIYYPALQPLATDLGVSLELINLTITSYLVMAGLAPSIIGDMADHTGRRPVYIVTFAIYFAANIGLAVQDSYAALLALRMLQSAGASGQPLSGSITAANGLMGSLTGTIAIAYGVISDIATPAERGSYVGVLMGLYVEQRISYASTSEIPGADLPQHKCRP